MMPKSRTFPRGVPVGRWFLLLATAGITGMLGGCGHKPPRRGPTVISFWEPYGGASKARLQKVIDEFEHLHPNIHIAVSYAANNLTSSQKLFLAIAGGVPPDVTVVDGQQASEWAARGALDNITGPVRQAGISGKDFWTPRWKESVFAGRVYALPWGADPNFALAWNKKLFRQAGLNPNDPPRTMAQLDRDIRRLTVIGPEGRIIRMGLIPWEYGSANSLFTWAYAFGGNFYDPPRGNHLIGRVTINNPRNIEALRWMAHYAKRYGISHVAAFQSNFIGVAANPFYTGQVAMTLLYIEQDSLIRRYAPTLDYGVSFIPAGPHGHYPTGWLGGWSLAIPKGSKVTPAAFEFIRWMCASPAGTLAYGKDMAMFPAYRKSPYYQTIRNNKHLMVFYRIVSQSTHARSLMPVQGYLMELLHRAGQQVFYNHRSARRELDKINRLVKERLAEVVRRARNRLERRR
jgi:ABC-type glycerol-3-phosphate transport system substrate-binding protein